MESEPLTGLGGGSTQKQKQVRLSNSVSAASWVSHRLLKQNVPLLAGPEEN